MAIGKLDGEILSPNCLASLPLNQLVPRLCKRIGRNALTPRYMERHRAVQPRESLEHSLTCVLGEYSCQHRSYFNGLEFGNRQNCSDTLTRGQHAGSFSGIHSRQVSKIPPVLASWGHEYHKLPQLLAGTQTRSFIQDGGGPGRHLVL